MSRSEMERDLSRHLQHSIGDVIERQMTIARAVLEPAEVAIVMVQAAVAVALTAAGTIASLGDDDAARGDLFDHTIDSITRFAKNDRERTIAVVRAKQAEAAR